MAFSNKEDSIKSLNFSIRKGNMKAEAHTFILDRIMGK